VPCVVKMMFIGGLQNTLICETRKVVEPSFRWLGP
jgi:hypothetical protein